MRDGWVLRLVTYLVCLFVVIPVLVVVGASLTNSSFMSFPPAGLTVKWYGHAMLSMELQAALRISLLVAVVVAVVSTLLGLGVSYALERYRFSGKNLVSTLLMAPLTIPMIVLAVGMLFSMTAMGLIRTIPALIFGHLVVTIPYALRALSAAVAGVDLDVERSAAILGASPLVTLLRVTLPMIMPGIMAAMMFSFLISFNNVTIALFVAGPRTQTLPLALFVLSENSLSPDLAAMASIVLVVTAVLMIILEKKFGIYSVMERGRSL